VRALAEDLRTEIRDRKALLSEHIATRLASPSIPGVGCPEEMPKVTVVNPWHWLNADGSFPLEPRLRKRIARVAQCIEYGGGLRIGQARQTLIACRGRGCLGFMVVLKQKDDAIQVFCASCTLDEFLIYEWEETPWAKGPPVAVEVASLAGSSGGGAKSSQRSSAHDLTTTLERTLALLGSPLSAAHIHELIAKSDHPGVVAEAVMASIPGPPPTRGAVERFLPVLMNVWNETSRPDLKGRSPSQAYHEGPSSPPEAAQPLDLGRNRPCPCGSGKKYKRCCISAKTN
jgi:hypothetical protein